MQQVESSKVFIIIVTYNGIKWIRRCLQSTEHFPVIVVDNNSNDGTVELIEREFPEVILLRQKKNSGFGIANNIGISYALKQEAEFVFLLNQDAFLKTDTVESLMEIYLNNPEYGILSPVHLSGDGKSLEKMFLYYLRNKCEDNLLEDLLSKREVKNVYSFKMINAAAWLLPLKTLNIVGGFHPMFFLYGEDDNYCQRVLYHGLKIGLCPDAFVIHDSENNNTPDFEEGSKKYFEKFLNRVRINYANVNTNEYSQLSQLKKKLLLDAVKSVVKMNWNQARLNFKKWNLVKDLNFEQDVAHGRKKKRSYL